MDYRYDIPTFSKDDFVNVVVEIPKGTLNKYEIDPENGSSLQIVRKLHKGPFHNNKYIFNYGFIPCTLAEDDDQLDAIIIDDDVIDPLTVVTGRAVAVIKTIDHGEQDDKVIVVPTYVHKKSISLKKIVSFLRKYKYPDNKSTTIEDIVTDQEEIFEIINKCRI